MISKKIHKSLSMMLVIAMLLSLTVPLNGTPVVQAAVTNGEQSPILITEILPNNEGTDVYEYIEFVNVSDKPIYTSDLVLWYNYSELGKDLSLQPKEDTFIQPGEVMVAWYNTSSLTLNDFNAHYGSSVTEEQLLEIDGDGFTGVSNGGDREFAFANHADEWISHAYYEGADIGSGLSAQYRFSTNGIKMELYAQQATPTPGVIDPAQIPASSLSLPSVATNHSAPASIPANADYELNLTIDSSSEIQAAEIQIKSDTMPASERMPMQLQNASVTGAVYTSDYQVVVPKTYFESASQLQYGIRMVTEAYVAYEPDPTSSYVVNVTGSVVNVAPTMTHTPVDLISSTDDLTLSATVEDAEGDAIVQPTVHVQAGAEMPWTSYALTSVSGHVYEAHIPSHTILPGELRYYLTAEDDLLNEARHPAAADTYHQVEVTHPNVTKVNQMPKLLITELVPDSTNTGSADGYEFIELYNNTTLDLQLQDYQILYRYPDDKPDLVWDITVDKILPSQQTAVIWMENSSNQTEDTAAFNANYGTALTDAQLFKLASDGMANGSERTLIVADDFGNEISSAAYNDGAEDDTESDRGIVYKYAPDQSSMIKAGLNERATPGSIMSGQVPAQAVDLAADMVAPVIHHIPVSTELSLEQDWTISADMTDDRKVEGALVYYQLHDSLPFQSVEMKKVAGTEASYTADIKRNLLWSASVRYYIEASDGVNLVQSDVHTTTLEQQEASHEVMPHLLVTEVVPDSTNVNGLDGYEFIEVYNNTDQPLSFKDYVIRYRYPMDGPEADLLWEPETDVLIPSGETLVFWIINSGNGDLTVADFNSNYGTSLVENEDIVRVYSNGMANGSKRGLIVATHTGFEVSAGYYNLIEGIDDTQANKGIVYRYPANGSQDMLKVSSGELDATPGSVITIQIPEQRVPLLPDTEEPVYTFEHMPEHIGEMENLALVLNAQDNHQVKTVSIHYRVNGAGAYRSEYVRESYEDKRYSYTIYYPEYYQQPYIEVYYTISDGSNTVTTPVQTIQVNRAETALPLRLNIQNDEIVQGNVMLKATSSDVQPEQITMTLDGEVMNTTTRAMESDAYFVFDMKKSNLYFKNGVTIGDEILHIFDDTINEYVTLSVPVPADKLQVGSNLIAVRSGTKLSPFDANPEENRDDFYMKNVRLLLADGTLLRDPAYADPNEELTMGDGGGATAFIEFDFNLASEAFQAQAYAWDTTQAEDGPHVVTAMDGVNADVTTTFFVDNTAPVVTPSVEEGRVYKGDILLDAEVTDAISSIANVTATLNGEAITLPYETSSAELTAGVQQFYIHAADTAGNEQEMTIHFTVDAEHPDMPVVISPAHGATGIGSSAALSVQVSDPTGDQMDVHFYRGFQMKPGEAEVKVYANQVKTEPPAMLHPDGETWLQAQQIELLEASDDQYVTTDSVGDFPYHRFVVDIDSAVSSQDEVELKWEGHSLTGRKVSMYVWQPQAGKWVMVADHIAQDEEDFTLIGNVQAGDALLDGQIHVIVQDEIPASPAEYDYTLVWISDTQYYSESYPHIFENQMQWIADNEEEMNIQYVFHTGDLVDERDEEYQWLHADEYMGILDDAHIPYGVLAGNHDVGHKEGDYEAYSRYFGEQRFKDKPYYGGSYQDNRGHYDLISAGGNDYVMVYMGWIIGQGEIDWINEVLKQHPDRIAILNFHEYLMVTGSRSPLGDQIYEQVVVPNPNVVAVLSGHYHDSETKIDQIDDDGDGQPDRQVYQMLADYQGGPQGGQGYIRLLHVDQDQNRILVNTYSTLLDDYNYYDTADYPGKDEFIIELDLQPKEKRVATDTFEANVYTKSMMDTVENVESGAQAEVVWHGLKDNQEYGWYVMAEDDFGGKIRSEVATFMTRKHTSDSGSSQPDTNEEQEREQPVNGKKQVKVKADPQSNGTIVLPEASLLEELEREDVNELEILIEQLQDSTGNEEIQPQVRLQFESSLLKKAKEKKKNLTLRTGQIEIKIPAGLFGSVLDEIGENTDIVLQVATHTEEGKAETRQAVAGNAAYEATDIVIDLTFAMQHEQAQGMSKEEEAQWTGSLNQFEEPITVSFKLTDDQWAQLDSRYAGVYYVNGDQVAYMGGTIENGQVTFETNHFSTYTVLEYHKQFADLSSHWAEQAVEELAAKWIVYGVNESEYAPDVNVTRGQLAALIARALKLDTESAFSTAFEDVQQSRYDADAIGAVAQAGIMQGYGRSFRPDDAVTREEAAVVLMQAYVYRHGAAQETGQDAAFRDAELISDWAYPFVQQAAHLNLIEGTGDGQFEPAADLTRAQAAMLIWKWFNLEE
ncbi:S-layer homology domain-containing protein [Marinicrinis sediminis]|uniref:S-layer homology domain-containing protein n=1 Tax=Marinicrinis sediminis TaxID=1652465 RepID=A0ABW5R903_9BACL